MYFDCCWQALLPIKVIKISAFSDIATPVVTAETRKYLMPWCPKQNHALIKHWGNQTHLGAWLVGIYASAGNCKLPLKPTPSWCNLLRIVTTSHLDAACNYCDWPVPYHWFLLCISDYFIAAVFEYISKRSTIVSVWGIINIASI